MAHFVEVKWDGRDRAQIGRGVRYISHREEALEDGRTRTLYGIGTRYRELRGDERAIEERLWTDGDGLRDPRYHRGKLTVDDAAARRLVRLTPAMQELVLRDAVEKSFAGVFRRAQGVFAVHAHGGSDRPHGHPHAHFRLSPLLDDGRRMVVTPRRLEQFKERWTVEVERAITRAERRPDRDAPPKARRSHERDTSRDRGERPPARMLALLRMSAGRAALRVYAPGVATLARAKDQLTDAVRDPGAAARAATFRLVTRALPAPLRVAVQLSRIAGRLRQED
jgi:hypothetical protein